MGSSTSILPPNPTITDPSTLATLAAVAITALPLLWPHDRRLGERSNSVVTDTSPLQSHNNGGTLTLRERLPRDLLTWRRWSGPLPSSRNEPPRARARGDNEAPLWDAVRPALREAGVELWTHDGLYQRADKQQVLLSSGFAYVTRVRGEEWTTRFQKATRPNALTWGGTTKEGHNVVVRVVCIGNEGQDHLRLLRKLSRGTRSLLTENHVVPLWGEAHFDDITFSISPLVGHSMGVSYGFWAKNSVGDVVDMLMQALEGVCFIHALHIAHRDLHKENFLVQWHPESLTTMQVPICRPRVFLTDFEFAFEFPPDIPPSEHMLVGLPASGYLPTVAPEASSGQPYDPYKADVWQLAHSFSDFDSTITQIQEVLSQMTEVDSTLRLTAADARDKLAAAVHAIPPRELLIAPIIAPRE